MNFFKLVYPYNGKLFSNKRKCNVDICYYRDEFESVMLTKETSPDDVVVKNPPANAQAPGNASSVSGSEDPLKHEIATHSSILAWKIPWTEELGRLQSTWLWSQTQLSTHIQRSQPQMTIFFSIWLLIFIV